MFLFEGFAQGQKHLVAITKNQAFPYLLKRKPFISSVFKGVIKSELKLAFYVCILATSHGCLDFVTFYKYNKHQQSLHQNILVSYISPSKL